MNLIPLSQMPQHLVKATKHPKCKGEYYEMTGDYDCGYGTTINCDQCKYGIGRKDPEAKCNQIS